LIGRQSGDAGLFRPFTAETRSTIDGLPALIDRVFPLPARFRLGLRHDVAELSRLLTSERAERSRSYLGRPALLSAYLRYFLPWNIFRLCRLLSSLPLELKNDDAVTDLGAGPLTLAASLWISRPDLRKVNLEFRCLDRTAGVLEAGKKFFTALTAGSGCPWSIRTIRGELTNSGARRANGLSVEIKGKPASLCAAVNVYNELYWDFSPMDAEGIGSFAERQARLLSSLIESSGSILVVEPGIPRSGEFISLLRSHLVAEGHNPLSPCVHGAACPVPGRNFPSPKTGKVMGKARWCHFSFDTKDAPQDLHKLSDAAGLPKEKAVLSFIFTRRLNPNAESGEKSSKQKSLKEKTKIRIISDAFPAGGKWGRNTRYGRYGCCERGLVLVTGSRESIEASPSGALEELPVLADVRDKKSGALIAEKKL